MASPWQPAKWRSSRKPTAGTRGDQFMTATATRTGIPAATLQVIGAGFGRTGTLSMRAALVRLGFGPCDHMVENEEHPERFALWDDALRQKTADEPIDWRPLLTGFQAIVDWPGAYFWRELTAAHSDAIVILTVRDPERWVDSVQQTIFAMSDEQLPEGSRDIIFTRTFNDRLTETGPLPGRLYPTQSGGARDDCSRSSAGL